jgi:hypothetical protein
MASGQRRIGECALRAGIVPAERPSGNRGLDRTASERIAYHCRMVLRAPALLVLLVVAGCGGSGPSASNLSTEIEQSTDAVFVGEPMAGGMNFWDDVNFVRLDSLPVPMQVGVSTRY